MSRACVRVEALIDKGANGLDDAERLTLEAHLGTCARCRETAALMRGVRHVLASDTGALGDRVRERAIGRALATERPRSLPAERPRWLWPSVAVAAAAAALIAVVPALQDGHQTPPGAQAHLVPTPARQDTTISEPATTATPENAWIEAQTQETRAFAHAQVVLAPDTRVRFDAESRTLELGKGRVDVEVDASKGQHFDVLTEHFRVVVLGTHFVVTPDSVAVDHGRVQVFGLDGSVLARELGAGAAFSYDQTKSARTEPKTSAKQILARARDALAHGDVRSAREFVLRAEEHEPHRQDRAEAGTLRAECALLERDAKAAVQQYLSVSERFPDLTAGENAAFAAAQITARSHDKTQARALYQRYLARYPRGRFADEARTALSH